jgi:hypothetical protein
MMDSVAKGRQFKVPENVDRWLAARPREAIIIAARAALRAFPFVAYEIPSRGQKRQTRKFLAVTSAVLKAIAKARAAALHPIDPGKLSFSSARTSPKYFTMFNAPATASAYGAAMHAAESVSYPPYAALACNTAVEAADMSPAHVSVYDYQLQHIIDQDFLAVSSGASARELNAIPLWGKESPAWAGEHWERIEMAFPRDQDWDVWTRWYRDILDGVRHEDSFELTFAGWDGEVFLDIWKNGPAAANKWIKEHLPKEQPAYPSVPALQPATLQPILIGEIVTLRKKPPSTDLSEAEIAAALIALKTRFERLLGEIESVANIDRRFPAVLRSFVTRLPAVISDLATLYDLGHELTALRSYEATVIAEWPSVLSSHYRAALLALDLTLQKFPDWRKFVATPGPEISSEQAEQITQISQIITSTARLDGPREHIDEIVPATLEALSNSSERIGGGPVVMAQAGRFDIARDELESINNLLKVEALILTETVGDMIISLLQGEIKKAGADIERGAREAKIKIFSAVGGALVYGPAALFVLIAANAAGAPIFPWLLKNFPVQFSWLEPFLRSWGLL